MIWGFGVLFKSGFSFDLFIILILIMPKRYKYKKRSFSHKKRSYSKRRPRMMRRRGSRAYLHKKADGYYTEKVLEL